MLSISEATVVYATKFNQVIEVFDEVSDPETGESSLVPSSSVPSVSASFNDSGVTILPSAGRVTISGQYNQSHSISWQYLDLTGAVKTSDTPPETGTFSKITKVDSPPRLIETCVYTIAGQTFTHTITIVSYDPIANTLKSLLAEVV
jgi:hypothetical protein